MSREPLAWVEADRAALDQWLELHVIARRLPADADSRALAEAALEHIVPLVAELPEEPPFVGVHNPTKPAKATIEPWIAAVEAAAGTPESGDAARERGRARPARRRRRTSTGGRPR